MRKKVGEEEWEVVIVVVRERVEERWVRRWGRWEDGVGEVEGLLVVEGGTEGMKESMSSIIRWEMRLCILLC